MAVTNSFNHYRKLKTSVSRFGGASFARVVAGDLLRYSYAFDEHDRMGRKTSLRKAVSHFIHALDVSEWGEKLFFPTPLFSINSVRADYEDALNALRNRTGTSSNKIQLRGIKRVRGLYIKNSLIGLYISLSALREEPWLVRFYFAGCFTFYLNTLSALRRIKSVRIPYYVAFNSSDRIESVFCEFLKERGIKTYSLQHGCYTIYKEPVPFDAINYENICADHLLCWGQYSIDQLHGYGVPQEKLLKAGWLKLYDVEPIRFEAPVKKILVLLGRQVCHQGNLKLLQILSRVKSDGRCVDMVIKLHPELNFSEYQKVCSGYGFPIEQKSLISDLLAGGEFQAAIAVNTTAYYEAYACGVACFRYRAEEYYERCEDIQDDIFRGEAEFKSLLSQYEACDKSQMKKDVCKRLEYVVGAGIDEYGHIFSGHVA